MNNGIFRPSLVLVVGILGLIIALAFNTSRGLVETRPERASDLAGVVRDMEHQRDDLEARLFELRSRMSDLERDAAADAGVRETFTRELAIVRAAAGLSGVRGPGVEVTLGDGTEVAPGADPNDYLIHDTDIAAVVNALFAAGAEAVDINGERVVATTPIRCAGTTVLVNASRLGSPYVIRAIGDSAVLESAVLEDPAAGLLFENYARQFGLNVAVRKVAETRIEPYRGSLRPQYLTPTPEG
jgi:uncharacterized protein YlxW (UPF0749 family)